MRAGLSVPLRPADMRMPGLAMMRPVVLPDPRRPGHNLALTTCWCARAFTLTAEEITSRLAAEVDPDPCPARFVHATAAAQAVRTRALQAAS